MNLNIKLIISFINWLFFIVRLGNRNPSNNWTLLSPAYGLVFTFAPKCPFFVFWNNSDILRQLPFCAGCSKVSSILLNENGIWFEPKWSTKIHRNNHFYMDSSHFKQTSLFSFEENFRSISLFILKITGKVSLIYLQKVDIFLVDSFDKWKKFLKEKNFKGKKRNCFQFHLSIYVYIAMKHTFSCWHR